MEHEHRRALRALAALMVVEGYGRSLLNVTLPRVGPSLGVGGDALSWALAAVTAGALGALVVGMLADHAGRRRVLLWATGAHLALTMLTATSGSLSVLVGWQALARAGQDGALAVAAVLAAESLPASQRGASQGWIGLASTVGSGLATLGFAAIDHVPGGWRGLFVLAGLGFPLLPLAARGITEPQPRPPAAPTHGRGRHLLPVLLLSALASAYDVAGFAFTTWVPTVVHGWSPGATSLMILAAGVVGLPGWWLGGRLADRVGRRPAAVGGLLALAAAQIAFFRGGSTTLAPAYTAMIATQGAKAGVLRAWATELIPGAWRGRGTAAVAVATTVGGSAGLAATGALAPLAGGVAPALAWLAVSGVVAAAVALVALPETRGRAVDEEPVAPQ